MRDGRHGCQDYRCGSVPSMLIRGTSAIRYSGPYVLTSLPWQFFGRTVLLFFGFLPRSAAGWNPPCRDVGVCSLLARHPENLSRTAPSSSLCASSLSPFLPARIGRGRDLTIVRVQAGRRSSCFPVCKVRSLASRTGYRPLYRYWRPRRFSRQDQARRTGRCARLLSPIKFVDCFRRSNCRVAFAVAMSCFGPKAVFLLRGARCSLPAFVAF